MRGDFGQPGTPGRNGSRGRDGVPGWPGATPDIPMAFLFGEKGDMGLT